MDTTSLDKFCKEIEHFIAELKKNNAVQLSQTKRNQVEEIANTWLDNYCGKINHPSIDKNILDSINNAFCDILTLSRKPNRVSSFITKFDVIYPSIFTDIYMIYRRKPINPSPVDFSEYFDKLSLDENEYLKEAIDCCNAGFLKASIVLGWCATIDKIHKKIEALGFEKFNVTSTKMKNQTEGRFKKFNKSQNVSSLSDLRTVFDSDLLWIIEGMELIDINQHTRLSSCFDMRCHSGHPGEAPITKYNTASFFSDIFEIVIVNEKFKIET